MQDIGTLLLRLVFGLTMALAHGWPKLMAFSQKSATFPDPLGVSAPVSMALAVGAEFGCALLLAAGLFTRAVCIPLIITMLVAAFVIHGNDPFQKKELALMYLGAYSALLFLGTGKYGLVSLFRHRLSNLPPALRWFLD